jgi:PIN domain nuclease of toxin-antitoxin system
VRLLLDTHILIWALIEPERLTEVVRGDLESRENEVLFSAASIWEMAIKAALGRANFQVSPDRLLDEALAIGFAELPVTSRAAARVSVLPHHHRDPFDRLLVAQAMVEPALLYTADPVLPAYSDLVVRV